jgi:small subunit ribosomal protein S20
VKGVRTLPQRKSGIKELRKNHRNHMRNLDIKTDLKKSVKRFLKSMEDKNSDQALQDLNVVYKKFDKAAKRNILDKNTASRRKARFSRLFNSLSQA